MAEKVELTKSLIEDKLRPDETSNFTWPITTYSQLWRFLLLGNIDVVIKPTSLSTNIGSQQIIDIVFAILEEQKGIEILNTIERVHSKGDALRPESVIYVLAACTCVVDATVKSKAYELVNKICDESAHFLMFIDFREKICKVKRQSTGWSKGHRRAVQTWYTRKNAIEVAKDVTKCPRYNHWTHKDVLRLTHAVPDKESEEVLYSFLVAGLKKTTESYKNESETKADESQSVLKVLEQIMRVKSCHDTATAVPLIKELKLGWDFIPSQLHKEPELWKGLFSYLPIDILISNVVRMAKLRLFAGDATEKATFLRRCSDAKEIKDSKLHPYTILAHREQYRNAMNDPKRKVSWGVDNVILSGFNKAISLAFEHNLTTTGKRFFITIDASDSMKAHLINNNFVHCRTAAACMALCLARAEKKAIVKGFSKELTDIKIDETTTVEDIVQQLDKIPLGGTDCSRPLIFAKGKKLKVNVFVVFTDKETWKGKTAPYEALKQYRKALQTPAKLIVVSLNANVPGEKQISSDDDRGMLDIYGFSSLVPKIIANFAAYNY